MGTVKKFILASVLAGCVATAQASWQQSLNNIVEHSMPTSQIGVMVIDAQTGKTIYEYNGDKSFTPASVLKVFSGAAALRYLGADYQYHTTVSLNPQQLQNGVLHGNLYIKFSGDPSLRVGDLQRLIASVHQYGVNSIQGKVVVDDTRFQAPDRAPGWTNDSVYWAYAAPITSVILDENMFSVNFVPGAIGAPLVVKPGLNMQYMQLQSNIRTVTFAQSMQDCSLVLNIDQQNTLRLTGCWPNSKGGWETFSVPNPTLFAEKIVQQALIAQHVTLYGQVMAGKQPASLTVVADHASNPFSKLLKHMLKESDNIYAGSVTKTLGSMSVGSGTFLQGVNTIKMVLKPMTGIDFSKTVISDGSGQSRYDLVTPQQLTQVLYAVYKNPKLQQDFIDALPIAGIDGTMRYRMGNFKPLIGKIQAKTGSMKGISTLAGYETTASGHKVIFAIMVNNIVGKLPAARAMEDKMCVAMYQI